MIEFIGIYCDLPIVKDEMESARYDVGSRPSDRFDFFLRSEKDREPLPSMKTIHCIQYKKLLHINPLLYHQPSIELDQSELLVSLSLCSRSTRSCPLVSLARQSILSLFERIFPNDQLICEYLLLHLLSRIYVRQPSSAYGKLSLNLSKISDEQCAALEQLLQAILCLHSRLAITVTTLNTMQLMPNKNVVKDDENSNNQLTQTPLQLPFNSHLLIDERQLECGQLTNLGRST